jgi:hypothetical protein
LRNPKKKKDIKIIPIRVNENVFVFLNVYGKKIMRKRERRVALSTCQGLVQNVQKKIMKFKKYINKGKYKIIKQ